MRLCESRSNGAIMRRSVLLIFSVALFSANCKSQNHSIVDGHFDTLDVYTSALYAIVQHHDSASESRLKRYSVSNETPSFFVLGWPFRSEIERRLGVDELTFIDERNRRMCVLNELSTLTSKRRSDTKVFFSTIVDGLFFAEVAVYKSKSLRFSDRPQFGAAAVYMFEVEGGNVVMLDVKEIHYN